MYASGTTECICPVFEQQCFAEPLFRANLCTYDFLLPDMYTTVLFSLTGGNLLRWFRDQWGQPEFAEAARSCADPYDLFTRAMAPRPTDCWCCRTSRRPARPISTPKRRGRSSACGSRPPAARCYGRCLEGVALEMRLNLEILGESGLAVRAIARRWRRRRLRPGATQGRRAPPPHHHAGRDRSRLPGRGPVGLRRTHRHGGP